MPFGYTGKQNNRSQHKLASTVGQAQLETGPAGARAVNEPLSASNPSAFTSGESFDRNARPPQQSPSHTHPHTISQTQQAPPHPPPHPAAANVYTGSPTDPSSANALPLHHSNTVSATFSPRQKDSDFADQVSRSQSQRFAQPIPPQPYGLASASVDNLRDTLNIGTQDQPAAPRNQSPSAGPKKQWKLIKNILTGNNRTSESHQSHQQPYGSTNSSGLHRRPSKRASQPPTLRTDPSQTSLEQSSAGWQTSRTSPLGQYLAGEPSDELHLQNPQGAQQNTVRQVSGEVDPNAPYTPPRGPTELAYLSQPPHIRQGQPPPEPQYGQFFFDQSEQQPPPPQQPQQQHHHHHQQQQQQQHQQQQQQQQQGQLQLPNHLQVQYQETGRSTLTASHPLNSSPLASLETVSQHSQELPESESDQHSVANSQPPQPSPVVNYPSEKQDPPSRDNPAKGVAPQQQEMPHPGRPQEGDKPSPYRHSQQPSMGPLPPIAGSGPQQPHYRQSTVLERQQYEGPAAEQGRNSPQPSSTDRGGDDSEKAFKDLLSKYKNVKHLYFDGKKEIVQLNLQIEQLQDAVANQRISQSRTSLDDNEYLARFTRLSGAITNLAFNIRKDWARLPSWLVPYVSSDALKTGKQEMTAVGRAVITRWIFEEVFNNCFHPGLEPGLSKQLKQIELNIRRCGYTMKRQEEHDALTSKVVSWRMATLEGLHETLLGAESAECKAEFARRATDGLTQYLVQHLAEPAPAGVDGGASMIIELAVAIAAHMPMESRDVAIMYPLPEHPIQPELMEVEKQSLPPLEPRTPSAAEDAAAKDGGKEGSAKDGRGRGDKTRPAPSPPKDPGMVRFAGFVGVEVRGKHVLAKAPVWSLA